MWNCASVLIMEKKGEPPEGGEGGGVRGVCVLQAENQLSQSDLPVTSTRGSWNVAWLPRKRHSQKKQMANDLTE